MVLPGTRSCSSSFANFIVERALETYRGEVVQQALERIALLDTLEVNVVPWVAAENKGSQRMLLYIWKRNFASWRGTILALIDHRRDDAKPEARCEIAPAYISHPVDLPGRGRVIGE